MHSLILLLPFKRTSYRVLVGIFSALILSSAVMGQQSALQDDIIFEMVHSGDGQIIAISYRTDIVDIIDATTGNLLHTATLTNVSRRITVSPEGDRFLWADASGGIHLYQTTNSTSTLVRQGGAAQPGPMTWNPTRSIVAIAPGVAVTIEDLSNNSLSSPPEGPTYLQNENASRVVDMTWSPDGSKIATSHYSSGSSLGPPDERYQMQIWDIEFGTWQTTPLVFHDQRGGGSVVWKPDGSQLALLASNELVIFDVETDTFIEELSFEEQNPSTLAWSPDGKYIATGGETIRIWDTDTWEVVQTIPAEHHVRAIQWSPDSSKLYSNRTASGLSVDVIQPSEPESALQDDIIFEMVQSGDGQVIALSYRTDVVDLIDANTGNLMHTANLPDVSRRITISPEGDRFFWADASGGIHLYEVSTSSSVVIRQGGAAQAGPMTWSPVDDLIAISYGIAAEILVLSNNTLDSPPQGRTGIINENASPIIEMVWSPDGSMHATSHYSSGSSLGPPNERYQMQIWDIELGTRQTAPRVFHDQRGGGSIVWKPDGTQLALLASNELVIYDLETDAFIEELSFEEQNPSTLAWSPDGKYIATGGETIRIWDTETWKVVQTIPAENHARAIQWSPDSSRIYSNRAESGLSVDVIEGG